MTATMVPKGGVQPSATAPTAGARMPKLSGAHPSTLLTAVMTVALAYYLVPLVWLVIYSTKTQSELFTTPGLSFGSVFALVGEHRAPLRLPERRLRVVAAQHRRLRRRGRSGIRGAVLPGRVRTRSLRLPRQARGLRGHRRRGHGSRLRARSADLPARQSGGPHEHRARRRPAVRCEPVRASTS